MKKLKYILILFILIIPIKVKASNIGLTCPTTNIKAGSEFLCTIFGPEHCTSLSFELILPKGFIYKSIKLGDNYNVNTTNNIFNFTGTGLHSRTVGVITIVAPTTTENNKFEISLKNIKYKYTANDVENTDEIITRSINLKTSTTTTKTTTSTSTTTKKVDDNQDAFILSIDYNGGVGDKSSYVCDPKNCYIDLSQIKTPIKENVTFVGWSENKNCAQLLLDQKYSLKSDSKIYACYKKNTSVTLFLDDILINNTSIEGFSKFKKEYEINIKEDIEDVDIEAISADENINIEIKKPETFINGKNIVEIILTKDNVTSTYKLNINKTNDEITGLSTARLQNIEIENYKLNFNEERFNYTLEIKYDVKLLNIKPILKNSEDSYIIKGNELLKDGSIIKITVYDKDSNRNEYTIKIIQNTFFDYHKTEIIVTLSIIIALIIYLIVGIKKGRFIKIKSKKKEKTQNKEKRVKTKKKDKNQSEKIETLDI